jgi:hypothetical protein
VCFDKNPFGCNNVQAVFILSPSHSGMDKRESFLRGNRHDDVVLFLSDGTLDADTLSRLTTPVENGDVLVINGEDGRQAFEAATGIEAMSFAQTAMETRGHIARDLTGGECPERGVDPSMHETEFIFAFSEPQNSAVGGLYERGDVVHAYAHCACGCNYADKWVIGSETETGVQPGEDASLEETTKES